MMIGDREGSSMLTSVTNRYGFQPHHFRLAHDITLDNGLGSVDVADTSFIFECNKENDYSRRLQQQQQLQQQITTIQSCVTDPSNSSHSISEKRHNVTRNSSLQILEARNLRNAAKSKLDVEAESDEKGDGEGPERGGGSGGGEGRDGDGSPEPAKKHKPDTLSFGGRTPRIEDLAFGREASRCGLNGVGGRQTTKKEPTGVLCRIKPEEPKQQTIGYDLVKGQTFIPVSSNVNCGTQSSAVSPRSATISQPLLAQIRQQRDSTTVTHHITRDRPRQLPSPPKPAPKLQQQQQPPPKRPHRPQQLKQQQQQQSSRILSLAEELQAAVMSESGSTDCSQLDASLFPVGFLQLDDILCRRGGGISQFLVDVAELGSPDQVDPVNKFRDVVCDMAYGSVVETASGGEDDGGATAAERRRRRRTSDPDGDGRTSSASSTFSRSSSTADSASPGDVEATAAATTLGSSGSAAAPVAGSSRLFEPESATAGRSPLRSVSSHRGTSAETTASTLGCRLLVDDDVEDRTTTIGTTKNLRGGHLENCASLNSSRSSSPARRSMLSSPLPTGSGNSLEFDLDEVDATHRGCHRFVPRHPGELAIEIADPIYVELEEDDLWCEGINLRTKQRGIFPTAYATDLSILDDVPRCRKFFLKYLGSIEVSYHRGNDVLCQAINRIVATRKPTLQTCPPPLVCLEINELGVKMTERTKNKKSILSEETTLAKKLARLLSKDKEPAPAEIDHLFSLKNICFCGYHPKNERYLGIISKHPLAMRFACHVFQSEKSTRTVAEVIGESFQKFYQEYLAAMHPTEDFYLE